MSAKSRREKELFLKGKYYNPTLIQNEIQINTLKKEQESKEAKNLKEKYLSSMKYDIEMNKKKRDDEVNLYFKNQKKFDLFKEAERVIDVNKKFVEERTKMDKQKNEKFQFVSTDHYQNYILNREVYKFF